MILYMEKVFQKKAALLTLVLNSMLLIRVVPGSRTMGRKLARVVIMPDCISKKILKYLKKLTIKLELLFSAKLKTHQQQMMRVYLTTI